MLICWSPSPFSLRHNWESTASWVMFSIGSSLFTIVNRSSLGRLRLELLCCFRMAFSAQISSPQRCICAVPVPLLVVKVQKDTWISPSTLLILIENPSPTTSGRLGATLRQRISFRQLAYLCRRLESYGQSVRPWILKRRDT